LGFPVIGGRGERPPASLVTEIPIETSWTKSTPKDENVL
jgi:hypothetical protein